MAIQIERKMGGGGGADVQKRSSIRTPRPYQAPCSGGLAPVFCAAWLVKDSVSLMSPSGGEGGGASEPPPPPSASSGPGAAAL